MSVHIFHKQFQNTDANLSNERYINSIIRKISTDVSAHLQKVDIVDKMNLNDGKRLYGDKHALYADR